VCHYVSTKLKCTSQKKRMSKRRIPNVPGVSLPPLARSLRKVPPKVRRISQVMHRRHSAVIRNCMTERLLHDDEAMLGLLQADSMARPNQTRQPRQQRPTIARSQSMSPPRYRSAAHKSHKPQRHPPSHKPRKR
jgi:hypothetical protein